MSKRNIMRGKAIVYHMGDRRSYLVDLLTGAIQVATTQHQHTIEHVPHDWVVHCTVFCRAQDGEEYAKEQIVGVPHRCTRSEFVDAANAAHVKMMRGGNPQHFVNTGWIALLNGRELSERKARAIYRKVGAWNYLAKWEATRGV